MAEYLTNTTDLTKVSAAIREKGGTSDLLVYPDGFVTAIQAISSGGEFVIEHGTKVFAEDVVLKNTPLVIQHSVNKSPFLFVGVSGHASSLYPYQVAHILKMNPVRKYTLPRRTYYDGYIMWCGTAGSQNVNVVSNNNNIVILNSQSVTINGHGSVAFLAGSTLNWYVVGLK